MYAIPIPVLQSRTIFSALPNYLLQLHVLLPLHCVCCAVFGHNPKRATLHIQQFCLASILQKYLSGSCLLYDAYLFCCEAAHPFSDNKKLPLSNPDLWMSDKLKDIP